VIGKISLVLKIRAFSNENALGDDFVGTGAEDKIYPAVQGLHRQHDTAKQNFVEFLIVIAAFEDNGQIASTEWTCRNRSKFSEA